MEGAADPAALQQLPAPAPAAKAPSVREARLVRLLSVKRLHLAPEDAHPNCAPRVCGTLDPSTGVVHASSMVFVGAPGVSCICVWCEAVDVLVDGDGASRDKLIGAKGLAKARTARDCLQCPFRCFDAACAPRHSRRRTTLAARRWAAPSPRRRLCSRWRQAPARPLEARLRRLSRFRRSPRGRPRASRAKPLQRSRRSRSSSPPRDSTEWRAARSARRRPWQR